MKEKKNENPSKTIPDMSYTVRELMQRFSTGGIEQVMKKGFYDEEFDPTEMDVDLVDVYESRMKLMDLKDRYKKEQAKLKKLKAENIKKAIEKRSEEKAEEIVEAENEV